MRVSIRDIQKMKADREPIVMITAYDATSARLSEAAGVPMLLVGDSLGMVIQGHDVPVPVTLEHIIYHAEIVTRVTATALIVGDMPFMSYNVSVEQALTNSARLMQASGVGAVKMEGGEYLAETIHRVTQVGIPVMAHIGLQPQSVYKVGGMRVQGRDLDGARQLLRDAQAIEEAGAFAVVLESVPAPLAEMITHKLQIPTIGIGAGAATDWQVQVFHDILGLFEEFTPRHAKHYAELGGVIREAIGNYARDVRERKFPAPENSFNMKDDVLAALQINGADEHAGH
ncbi:MAG: 3-methyl-2-oxobutanoate hydroxymethyltransferase [Chloroflexi bacterium]|uniref:3-methyl-2-oxobutanoate hydroxymethyltransferase n=1 Tax=Candidatus Flexifilum breve TaxID=3140694 RepID=UPI003137621B|nr:3-methyl-2-oxobutanoate hydroxymethyltransferase [Chloroflexota bacterium]